MAFGFLSRLAESSGFGDQLAKWSRDKDFMQGAMAAAAWVAAADKTIGERERSKVAGFIQRSDFLKAFDRMQCIQEFNNVVNEFEFDYGMGVDKATKELSEVSDPAKCLNIGRLAYAIAVSEADANDTNPISDAEREVLTKICSILRISTKDLGL